MNGTDLALIGHITVGLFGLGMIGFFLLISKKLKKAAKKARKAGKRERKYNLWVKNFNEFKKNWFYEI